MPALRVVVVVAADAERLRAVRRAALANDPEGFGSTLAQDSARPARFWTEWAEASEVGQEQRTFAVARDDGDWLGLALVRLAPDRPGEAELFSMWVAPAARGAGAARMLCDACAQWTASRGAATLALGVYAANTRARRAYEKCGFSLTTASPANPDLLRMERAT